MPEEHHFILERYYIFKTAFSCGFLLLGKHTLEFMGELSTQKLIAQECENTASHRSVSWRKQS